MNKLTFLLPFALLACKGENTIQAPPAKEIKTYSIAQIMDNEAVSGGSFSPDNSKLLITSNRSGIYNMYTVPVAGGAFSPVTASDSSSVFAISYFPDDERMLFRMDNNGDELYHIFLMDVSGTSRDLTPDAGARTSFYSWAEDDKSFFYGSNKRDSKYMDLYEMDIESMTSKMRYRNTDGMEFGEISPDKSKIALIKPLNTNDNDLYLANLKDKSSIKVNRAQSANTPQDFSIDNKFLYYTTDEGSEYAYLMKYNIIDGIREKVMEREWDISGSYFTEMGNYLVTYINEDGKNAIEVMDVATGKNLDLPTPENASITSVEFSADEKLMRYYAGGSDRPYDLWVSEPGTTSQKQLTQVLNKEISAEDLVAAEVIRYKSFDGLEIPAIYYKPHQATSENKTPALVWVHGGPGGQSGQYFNATIQYLVNHGYAILAVNNRGSSGYGKSFFKMDDLNHGDKDLKDCIAGKKWLTRQKEIDEKKIGIIGGSYGGYMTMAALTYAPEEFKVGVNLFGVTNWIRTLRSIPPWWESFKDALYLELGDPNSADSVRLREISPLFHTENVTKPLIVLQGKQDPRVLQAESDEIVAGVRKNGVPVEYVLFEDEGHGFVKKENQIEAYSKILEFLDTYLKKDNNPPLRDGAPTSVE